VTVPQWFSRNIAVAPERGRVEVDGCSIETLAWGDPAKRGLLLAHGLGANAEWWLPFAPFFADEWRVGALSFSGMGRSGWRDCYDMPTCAREMAACADALGLFDGGEKPWLVAHSMGGIAAIYLAASQVGARFGGIVLVDSGTVPSEDRVTISPGPRTPHPGFASRADGVARFRLRPPQGGVPGWFMEFLAEKSLYQREDGRWYWHFDPNGDANRGTEFVGALSDLLPRARCPLAFVWGEDSVLMTQGSKDLNRAVAPSGTRFVEIPTAHHLLMLDQPEAFVTALRVLLG
jgi:pimeloyl-ACP methyl ester carboxylesterase